MANIKFKLDCPKCETEILVRSSSQIGQKTECPKCKYRFTVPDVDEDEDDDGNDAPPRSKGEKNKKAGSSKVLIGVVLGVLALGGLALGAVLVLGGSDDKKTTPVAGGGGGGGGGSAPTSPQGPNAGGGENPENPGANPEVAPSEIPTPPKTKHKPRPSGLKEITNLLPGDAVSVWHLHMDELARTPLYASIFDRATKELFLKSMTFDPADVDEILHCYVGADKDAFAIIRTKGALDADELLKRLDLESPKNNNVKGRDFFLVKSNGFLTAIGKSLSLGAVLGTETRVAPKPKAGADRPMALSLYDSQTIILADSFLMERFLNDLKEDGLPPFKSVLTEPEPTTPPMGDPMGPMGGFPMGPMGGFPMGPMGGFPKGPGSESSAPRNQIQTGDRSEDAQLKPLPPPGAPNGGAPNPMGNQSPLVPTPPGNPTGRPAARKSYTSNPYFRTIEPDLKKAMNTLEDEDKEWPAIVYVQKVDQRALAGVNLREFGLADLSDTVLFNWLQHVKIIGFSISTMNKSKLSARGYFEYLTDDDARKSVAEHILPVLNSLKLLYALKTFESVTINDYTSGQGPPGSGPLFPGEGGTPGFPMFPGGPMGPMGGGGGLRPLAPPGGPGGGGPGAGPGGRQSSLPHGQDHGNEDAQLKPLAPPGSPNGPGPGPLVPPVGGSEPGSGPGFPNPAGTPGQPGSHVDITLSDTVVNVEFEIEWKETTYTSVVLPGLGRMTAQLKGRMSVLSGENDFFSLATALNKIVKDQGSFPMGTLPRDTRPERYGLPYSPEQRVSLFAELLPFLGKAGLRTSIQDKRFAWYAKENLPAAETWVPEFLVPYYDQSSWRATHELADGRTLGATNYVGIAGLGLDAARYDPKDSAVQKKLGLYGYDWKSRPEEVTDGLSNTIALMQVPPGYQRPWIAGGGATLAGIDERGDKPLQNYSSKLPDGTRGTTVLMGDGSVRVLRETMNPALFKAMVTRAGGDNFEDLDKVAPVVPRPKKSELTSGPAVSSVKAPVVPKEVDAEELKKFQGNWTGVLLMELGKELTAEQIKKESVGMAFKGNVIEFTEKGRKVEAGEIVKLDPTTSPKSLDIKPAPGGPEKMILVAYEFEGKRLKLLFSKDAKERPKKFAKPEPDDKTAAYIELEKDE